MTLDEAVEAVASAPTWDARIALIRLVPEEFGTASHHEIYAAIARRVYVPSLAPDFAYVHWRHDYELQPSDEAYGRAHELTSGFSKVEIDDLKRAISTDPTTLRIFRLILGFTAQEFAAATVLVADSIGAKPLTTARIRAFEAGRRLTSASVDCCAAVVDLAMSRRLFGESPTEGVRLKTDKPDTDRGWDTIDNTLQMVFHLPSSFTSVSMAAHFGNYSMQPARNEATSSRTPSTSCSPSTTSRPSGPVHTISRRLPTGSGLRSSRHQTLLSSTPTTH
ncbi:MAG TPA: hypothetical protein VG222_10745 [Vicinamibacterales bacterium]|nr:hypothetical protein [Vicinamibacterales bacterium]